MMKFFRGAEKSPEAVKAAIEFIKREISSNKVRSLHILNTYLEIKDCSYMPENFADVWS